MLTTPTPARAPDGADDAQGADARLTADRDEIKYLVKRDRLAALTAGLSRRLPSHRFTGEGANRLPDPHSFVTTVYFDTPSGACVRAARDDRERNMKVRAKEYYDLHPSLAELATDPRQIVRYQPWLWFELKRREGARTSKRRFRLPKRDVPAFFAEGRVTPEALVLPAAGAVAAGAGGDATQATQATQAPSGPQVELQAIADYCRVLAEPLSAACLVNYRRLSWQANEDELRVTVDLDLAFYPPPPDLWTRQHALVRSTLGPARGAEARAVLEVKSRGALPSWMDELLDQVGAVPARYSKFLVAADALAAAAGASHG